MAVGDIQFGGTRGLGSSYLQPSQGKNLYSGNYLDFFDTNSIGSGGQWAQQFLPDVYEKEAEIYGNRTISSFLRMVSAEMPSTSDQVIWTEQGRLHTRYTGLQPVSAADGTTGAAIAANANGGATVHFYLAATQRGPSTARGNQSTTQEGDNKINFRVGQTVMIQQENLASVAANSSTDTSKGVGNVMKGIVSEVNIDGSENNFSVVLYTQSYAPQTGTAIGTANAAAARYTALVYGSEFAKGTGNFTEKLDPSYSTYSNSPIIMKEHYSINGSDTTQIGWIEVTSENGASGYLWYVKAEHENRLRWEDYQEMAMLEAVPQLGNGGFLGSFRGDFGSTAATTNRARGTQGLFHALQERGNMYDGLSGDLYTTRSNTGTAGIDALAGSFDVILKQLDKQGAIEENMLYVNRDLALAFDNFLATQNNYGGAAGVSWGVFNNAKDMAVDLGFSGFRRGSYDFYKTDWKYLNDISTRGGFGDIEGVMIPAGTSTVYDGNLGKNIKRPFLHVRYRSSETENRKMKSWITGSVGGAYTTDVDEMRMHYLTERCLITQGANNFFLLT